jgi:hypothetical protein
LKQPLRKDAADSYSKYRAMAASLLEEGRWITNSDICERLSMPKRTGSQYWNLLKTELNGKIEVQQGRIRTKSSILSF